MKRIGSISCICSAILLSACSLPQPQPVLSDEDIAAQLRAACELDTALEIEEKRLLEEELAAVKAMKEQEARRKAEEMARKEAERKAKEEEEARREAEEKAREEAERKTKKDAETKAQTAQEKAIKAAEAADAATSANRTPRLLSSRGGRRPQNEAPENIVPTAEQQKAAQELLNKNAKSKPTQKAEQHPAPSPAESKTLVAEEPKASREEIQLPGSVTSGALRTRRFAPPEEAISRGDDDEPLPNSVEMRGLRSPVMNGKLPMDIDGKIIKEN